MAFFKDFVNTVLALHKYVVRFHIGLAHPSEMKTDRTAASEGPAERPTSPSSEHPHSNNLHDADEHDILNEPYLVNAGTSWTWVPNQRDRDCKVKASNYGLLTSGPALRRPRWTMVSNDGINDEKNMHSVGRRRCARLGLGILIFL